MISRGVGVADWYALPAPNRAADRIDVHTCNDEHAGFERYAIVSHKTGRVVATGKAELVWCHYREGRRAALPQTAREQLFKAA